MNEQDTFFVDCKHKHMMNCGATPDKFGALYLILVRKAGHWHTVIDLKSLMHLIFICSL